MLKKIIKTALRLLYNIKITGLENIPEHGPAIIICNHQSYLDAVVLCAFSPRDITFLSWYKLFESKVLGFILKAHKDIPIKDGDAEQRKWAFNQCCDVLSNSRLLCLYPEGSLSPDGEIHEFKKGLKHLWSQCAKPIIPIAIDGFYDTAFSRKPKHQRRFKDYFKRKTLIVNIGPSMSFSSPPDTALLKKIIEVLQKH